MTKRWLLTGAALALAVPASGETLRDAIAAAWDGNPQLAAARARQEALAETPNQARAAGRLTAAATGGAGYDRLGYDDTGRRSGASSGTGAVTATLPIWTGGRVRAAVRAADGDVAAGGEALRDVEADVLERVVGAYADLLYTQQAVEIARVGIERLDRQVAEARSRYGLGQATRTDIAQLEAQRASVVSNLVDAEGAAATAAASYRAVVGRDAGALDATIAPPTALPRTLADARGAAEAANPLLLAQRQRVEAASARVDQARAERAPALDLTGNYGRGVQVAGGRWTGFDSAASAGLGLRVPLLTGGLVASHVRQAEAVRRAERFDVETAARNAVRSADTAWASLIAAEGRLKASVEGLAAADLALKGVRAEYGFGLRSTIDILVADQSYRSAQLAVARAKVDVLTAQAALLRATGRMGRGAFD
ncbi:outer membrane protein [Sphingomonas sp. SORGH_AS 950]|uniref:TolC family outer membrane protein n=1 Tax=Sphingomonas sp. SORGH_AS_0950 TaxID=3041792 RepID=UPI002788D9CB|nr:TolC family outer membrane protein [Sphingomonas sp. SORGH_AS_0950]MDQ1155697.1 outer membrane protein [Sphingomonas sp. SORGH_AS_0950]